MENWKPVEIGRWEVAKQTHAGDKRFEAHVSLRPVAPGGWHALFKKAFGTTTAADLMASGDDQLVLRVEASLIKDVKTRVKEAVDSANTSYAELLLKEQAETQRAADKIASDKAYRDDLERELNE